MIYLIMGASHCGKTYLAQKLLEKHKIPYLSIDHLKMGLIRSKNTNIKVCEDDKLEEYLWPIVKEMIKTAIENNQSLIIEGCYIPFSYRKDFSDFYLKMIKSTCLIFSSHYINNHFEEIKNKANIIENRFVDDDLNKDYLINENKKYLNGCLKYNLPYLLINDKYEYELPF